MMRLLPRLPGPAASRLLEHFLSSGDTAAASADRLDFPEAVRFAATGPPRASIRELMEFRNDLGAAALRSEAPELKKKEQTATFDADLAVALATAPLLQTAEALRDDVWSFITCVLVPELVHSRFGTARERYLGGRRNALQRLWLRGRLLDRGEDHPVRWFLLDQLTEDAMVQIEERPSIGADPRLARAIAEAWVTTAQKVGKRSMEPIMRRATRELRMRREIRALNHLADEELKAAVEQEFDRAI